MLLDLTPETTHQGELDLEELDLSPRPALMTAIDALNARFGRGTICIASAGSTGERQAWKMRQERLSPHYTTRWSDLPVARAN